MMNCTQLGNISQEPRLNTTTAGTVVLNFSVASNDRRQGKDAPPIFMQWSLFGKQAEGLHPFLYKGMKILVHGRLQMNHWVGQDGQSRQGLQGMANGVELLSPKRADSGPPPDDQGPPMDGGEAPPAQRQAPTNTQPGQRPPPRQAARAPAQPADPQYDPPPDF